jgi:hypothetical protein
MLIDANMHSVDFLSTDMVFPYIHARIISEPRPTLTFKTIYSFNILQLHFCCSSLTIMERKLLLKKPKKLLLASEGCLDCAN